MLKGQARFVFTDINTGEITQEFTRENFIFENQFTSLWTSGNNPFRVYLIGRGSDVYPIYSKEQGYFGKFDNYTSGYAPSGTALKTFFPKTSESPAYWEFYSLFLPPSTTQAIPCIGLSAYNSGDNYLNSNSNINDNAYAAQETAINLNPPCYQSPTEYLNVYYRLIMVEDAADDIPDYIKNEFILDTGRGTGQFIYPQDNFNFYPFRVSEGTTATSKWNFLSDAKFILGSKQTTIPTGLNHALRYARKTYTYPDAHPNQYTQINNAFVKTLLRGGKTRIAGVLPRIHPENFVPEIGAGITGIGNVFSTSSGSDSQYFDAAFFPIGTGKMFAGGEWVPEPMPKRMVVEIQQTGQTTFDATYRVKKYSGLFGANIPLLPAIYGGPYTFATDYNVTTKNKMFKDPESIHLSQYVRVYKEEHSFITWDATGITICDVYNGKLTSYDSNTTPALGVNDVRDVKVDTLGNIWIACGNTGLWKLFIDGETVTLTHIGQLPGSLQKCYAIDVDNFGNLWAVFWGAGVYVTLNQGTDWVNLGINYAPFSDYDEGATNSKWRYCTRIICNPFRDAGNNTGQLLILNATTSPDGASTAGCWYDQQSLQTTGITNATLRASLNRIRDDGPKVNVAISELFDKWCYVLPGTTSTECAWIAFQTNAAYSTFTGHTYANNVTPNCFIQTCFDYVSGTYKEYLHRSAHFFASIYDAPQQVIDLSTNAVVLSYQPSGGFNNAYQLYGNLIPFGKNMLVGFVNSEWAAGNQSISFMVYPLLPPTKVYATWTAESYGWDGAAWVKDNLANRTCHTSSEEFERGIMLRFEDGPESTTSFYLGDKYTFTCYDGFYKDNASKMELKDTVYFKPKEEVTIFEPATVQVTDNSGLTGLLNSADINDDWNLDQLPDCTYDGAPLVTDGDALWPKVTFMSYFNDGAFTDEKFDAVPTSVVGTVQASNDQQLFGEATTYFNGVSGLVYATDTKWSFGSGDFTAEGHFWFEEVGRQHVLIDFRDVNSSTMMFYVDGTTNRLSMTNGTIYGNTGVSIVPGQWYHIQYSRTGNVWSAAINGVVQWSVTLSAAFAASRPLRIGTAYDTTNGSFKGYLSNLRLTKGNSRYPGNHDVPSAKFKTYANSFAGARIKFSGEFNEGGIYAKRELVGNWTVVFKDIPTALYSTNNGRPKLYFGVSPLAKLRHHGDMELKILQNVSGSTMTVEQWRETWYQNRPITPGSADAAPPSFIATSVRFRKLDGYIYVESSDNEGLTWTHRRTVATDSPVHYINMWQMQPIIDMSAPAVEIVENGSAIFSRVGDPILATGRYNPTFIGCDNYWEHDFQIQLNGVPTTKNRSNYQSPADPLEGECYLHLHGFLKFHQADVGKTITGKVVCLRD